MDFVNVFRILVPEYKEKTDEEILGMLEILSPHLSKKKLGSFYNEAASYLVAHHFSINTIICENGSQGASLMAGAVISEKEGDLARTYADGGSSEQDVDPLDKTFYGKKFKEILKKKIFSACTRMG